MGLKKFELSYFEEFEHVIKYTFYNFMTNLFTKLGTNDTQSSRFILQLNKLSLSYFL